MAKYKSIVVTNGGLALIAAAHSGDTIEFTAIKTGAGIYDGTEVLAEATALKDIKQTLGISGLVKDDNVIKVNTTLSNDGLDTGYSVTELGLYAKDSSGNEILYAIVIAEPGREDYIPAYADAPTTVTFELYVDATAYESGVTFQATVIAGTYATPQDVSDAVASMTSRMGTIQSSIMQEVNTGLAKKVNILDIVDNLLSTATNAPVSANQARILKEYYDTLEKALMTGVSLANHDFNNLGDKPLNGIGTNMANGPIADGASSIRYHVQHIPAYDNYETVQYAKPINYGSGSLLFFRQQKHDKTWSEWTRVATSNDIIILRDDIIIRVGSGTATVNIASGATGVIYPSYNEEGYTRIGVIGFNFKNNNISVIRYDETSFTLLNRGTTAITEVNYEVRFLLKKKSS